MDFDTEQFIFEIESREGIWNVNCDEYSDRIHKMTQWNELISIFTDENASAKERRKQGLILRKRWRTLRDAFVKQNRGLASSKSGSAATNKKLYKYYNQLLFLLPVVGKNTEQNIMTKHENNSTGDSPHASHIIPTRRKIKKFDSTEKIGRELVNVLKSTLKQKSEDEDPDRQFLLSLVSDFKNVPAKLKASVKMNILECIMEAQFEE